MKKLLSVILISVMIIGMIPTVAFAAVDNGNTQGEIKVVTTKTEPSLPTEIPEEIAELYEHYNTKLVFEERDITTGGKFVGIPLKEGKKAGILVEDLTAKSSAKNQWHLTVDIGDFCQRQEDGTVTATEVLPGFKMIFVEDSVYGSEPIIPQGMKPEANGATLSWNGTANPQVIMRSGEKGSPGYWASTWDVTLNTEKVKRAGTAVADMYWTVATGLNPD